MGLNIGANSHSEAGSSGCAALSDPRGSVPHDDVAISDGQRSYVWVQVRSYRRNEHGCSPGKSYGRVRVATLGYAAG